MRLSRIMPGGVAALPTALVLAACASAGQPPQNSSGTGGLSAAEAEAIYRARTERERQHFTEADVRFMTSMIHHHAQALEMSRLVPTHDASPEIRTLAARIINAQNDEIATMQQWLRDRGQPVPELHVSAAGVMVHGTAHAADMPGMLSPAQMRRLDEARGAAFDSLFLVFMIQHHQGAVTMVHELFATDGAGQDEAVFKFASDAQVDQATEVARMERMLAALSDAGGSR